MPVLGQADTLPAGWQDTPAAVYRSSAAALAAQSPPAGGVIASIGRQAAERLKNFSQQGRASFDSLLDLYEWGRGELRRRTRNAVLEHLMPTSGDVRSWDLAPVHRAHDRMAQLAMPASSANCAERVAGGSPRRRDAARRYGERSRGACRRSLLAVQRWMV